MKIVIIGAVAAGAKAAAKIKRLLPDSSVEIFTKDTHVSYSSCGLPYYIQGNFEDYRTLLVRSPEEFRQGGIDVNLETNAEKIYPEKNVIVVSGPNGRRTESYDRLIIATGASPIKPNIKGIDDFINIFTLRNIEDGINIRTQMRKSKKAVIIGSGYIGLELMEAFVKNGLETVVIEQKSHIMSNFDDDMSDLIRERIESSDYKNFKIVTGDRVSEFFGENGVLKSVITEKGQRFDTDLAIICAGVKPNIELAQDAGLKIGETGAIEVDKLMRTSHEHIYACGDCAEKTHIVSGKKVWIPLGSTANKEGRCAALNAAGIYSEFEGVLGSTVTRCLNTTMSMTGLTEREAEQIGFTPVSVTIEKPDKVAFMPDASDITLKVIADKITGLLLGGQAIGSIGADKRIYSLTSALLAHLTVEEFGNNDLTYSPPYSPTIDPLLNATQALCKRIAKSC